MEGPVEPVTLPTPLTPLTDLSVGREPVTFDALYRAHRDRVYRWAVRFAAGRTAWAEDVTHDVFLQLHRHLHRLDTDDLGAWLYRVTANQALARLRHESSWVTRILKVFSANDPVQQPDEALERRDDASLAMAALEKLPPKERMCVSMHVLDELSQREIARTLGMSEGYVSKLLTRAWDRLRADGWEVGDDS
ncbi:MAG: sigma-70 family RNA polymerase sigma factor [Archangium sp.]|nr:sigma-70 family RNA polymerase sigma factor [Archangium sp.]